MQNYTKQNKQEVYKRDILRDYALSSSELEAQFARFEKSGTISFSILRGLLGEAHSKGILWRLKDTTHHLFNSGADTSPAFKHLDWAIGFLFHECVIILECSYQMQKYYPAAQGFIQSIQNGNSASAGNLRKSKQALGQLVEETQRNLSRMIERIKYLLEATNSLMCVYLENQKTNKALARLIYEREELLRPVFKGLYNELLSKIYGDAPEQLYSEAASSLFESGQLAKAARAAEKALELGQNCPQAREILDKCAALRQ